MYIYVCIYIYILLGACLSIKLQNLCLLLLKNSLIKEQAETITKLQNQLEQKEKNTQYIHEIDILKQEICFLKAKNIQLSHKIEIKEKTKKDGPEIKKDFDSFRARILDIPWWPHLGQ